jgi:16S rRNA C1402 (ribose-2'-O) methylase RsmI
MRELTKTHEDVILSDLENIENILLKRKESNIPLLGEIVVVISGYQLNSDLDIDIIKGNIKEKLSSFSLRDTVNMIVSETGLSKKIIYEEAIKINNENINTKK